MLEDNNVNSSEQEINNEALQEEIPVEPINAYNFVPETYKRKREIRKLAHVLSFPLIFVSVIGYLWSIIYLFFTTKLAGMTTADAIALSQNSAVQQILQIILSCFMFLVPFTIAAKLAGVRIDQTIMFSKSKKGTFLPFILFGIGFCSFSNISMSYASGIFQSFGIDYDVDFGDNPEGIFGFLLSFIATAIVPALVEEFACRGIMLGLLKKYGEGFAIVTSAIIFGIMHGNFEQIPFAVMVGLILGYIYVKTENIWTCIAVHSANNAISVVFTYLEKSMSVNMQNLLYTVYLIISMLVGVIAILLFAKNSNENYSLKKEEDIIPLKEKYTTFFATWTIILFIISNFAESLLYFVI